MMRMILQIEPFMLWPIDESTLWFFAIVLLVLIAMAFWDMSRRRRSITIRLPSVKTELMCPSCGLKEVRQHKEMDYVMKKTNEKCRKCEEMMVISGIYTETKEDSK